MKYWLSLLKPGHRCKFKHRTRWSPWRVLGGWDAILLGWNSPNIYSNMDINTNLTASHISGLVGRAGSERGGHSMRNKNCTIDDNDIMTISRLNPIINDCSLFISPSRKIKKKRSLTGYLNAISQILRRLVPTLSSPLPLTIQINLRNWVFHPLGLIFVVGLKMSICVMNRIENTVDIINKFSISNLFATFFLFRFDFCFFLGRGMGEAQVWVHKKFITLDPLSPTG